MSAQKKQLAGNVTAARELPKRVFVAKSENEGIWLVAVKLEAEKGVASFSFGCEWPWSKRAGAH